MKKVLAILLAGSILAFGATNNDIEKKLDFLIKKMNKMEKKLDSKDKEIQTLKSEVKKQKVETKKQFTISNCTNIKVKNFNYIYHKEVLPYYILSFTLVNKYPYAIKEISGKIIAKDSDGVTMLTDFVSKDATIQPNGTINIKKYHTIEGDLEKTMAQESPQNIAVTFSPITITFQNGEHAKCGGFLGSYL